jgi:MOSC domain-containing protein YiiM
VIKHFSASELNSMVGKIFYLGGLAFKGTELCSPCQRPAKLMGRPDFIKAFEARGGIRAEALESGSLVAEDLLTFSITPEK